MIRQNWHTEEYKGMEIHVTALPHRDSRNKWDYTVRIAQPGADASESSELTAGAGDDADYASEEAAVQAGLLKGHAMVDRLTQ